MAKACGGGGGLPRHKWSDIKQTVHTLRDLAVQFAPALDDATAMRWAPVGTMVCVAQHARDYTTHRRRTTTTVSARALVVNAKQA
eukprot:9740250-Alexandrium_andersonii.AAC.1